MTQQERPEPAGFTKALLVCGVIAPLLYVAADIATAMRAAGYSYRDQTISELMAIDAPTRPFLLPFFVVRERAAFRRLIAGDLLLFAACSVIFVAFPVAFERPPLPPQPWDLGAWVLSLVQGNDPPWNCLPSEHCAVALLAALATRESDRRVGAYALVTALLIGLSTLYTKQHYLVDVLAGYGIALIIYRALKRGGAWAEPRP